MPTPLAVVQDFLAQKRIAFAGLSRNTRDFSHILYREFRRRGYDVIGVNPSAGGEIDGEQVYASVAEVEPKPDAVLVMTAGARSPGVVEDCRRAGVTRVWLYRGGLPGAVNSAAIEACRKAGIAVVEGECPLMFFEGKGLAHLPHKLHGVVKKLTGSYPH
jgi:predicted CoA-binding protein